MESINLYLYRPGSIFGIKLPISDLPLPVPCHSGRGIKLLLSYDEKLLISISDDGSMGKYQK